MRDLSIRAERRLHLLALFCDAQTSDPLAAAQKAEAWVFGEEAEEELEPEIAESADDDPWGNGTGITAGAARDGRELKGALMAFLSSAEQPLEGFSRSQIIASVPGWAPNFYTKALTALVKDGVLVREGWAKTSRYWRAEPAARAQEPDEPTPPKEEAPATKAAEPMVKLDSPALLRVKAVLEGAPGRKFKVAEIAELLALDLSYVSFCLNKLLKAGIAKAEGATTTRRYWSGEAAEPAAREGALIPYAGKHDFHGFTTGQLAKDSYSKPKAEPVKRSCLGCGKGFTAEGRFQRMCPDCRGRASTTPYDPI